MTLFIVLVFSHLIAGQRRVTIFHFFSTVDSFDASEAVRRYSAKQYLRKSRRGETTKEDIDHRINHKRKGEYDNIDLGYKRKRRKDKKFWESVNKRLRDKGIDPHVFDEDIPY